jgi:hypothetical protein
MAVSASAFYLLNLHDRIRAVNEQNLAKIALVLATQLELFRTAEGVQADLVNDIAAIGTIGTPDGERLLSRHEVYLKLRDKAAGMPYVGSLTIIDAQGKLINFSRQWPTPKIDSTDREYFKALQSNPGLTSYIGKPVSNRANGSRVVHLARRISGQTANSWARSLPRSNCSISRNISWKFRSIQPAG